MLDIVISGLLLSGTYALVALGLNLQYGVSRIMNLANGEMLVLGALAAFWMFTVGKLNPYLTMVLAAPLAFVGNWLIYRFLLRPLVSRSKNQGQLEVDSILATFGMSFILIGIMISIEGGFFAYKYLSIPIEILGTKASLSRIVAFAVACCIGLALYLWLNRSRTGMAVRAVAVSPQSALLVGINVPKISALAFALGGAITAVGGVLISTFITLDASIGVIFTMKALIIVIMGGVGDTRGVIIAAVILGLVETTVATLIDPGGHKACLGGNQHDPRLIYRTSHHRTAGRLCRHCAVDCERLLALSLCHRHDVHRLGDELVDVLRPDPLYLAGHSRVLWAGWIFAGHGDERLPATFLAHARHCALHRRCSSSLDRVGDAAAVGGVFRDFHPGFGGNDPKPCELDPKQLPWQPGPLCPDRLHREAHLLDVAGRGGHRLHAGVAHQPQPIGFLAAHHRG